MVSFKSNTYKIWEPVLMFENEIGLGLKLYFLLKCFFFHTHTKKKKVDVDVSDGWRQTSNHRTAEEHIMTSFHWGEMPLYHPSSSLIMFFSFFVWRQKHFILHSCIFYIHLKTLFWTGMNWRTYYHWGVLQLNHLSNI